MFDDLQETVASIAKSGLPLQGKLDALKIDFETNLARRRPSKPSIAPSMN